MAVEVHLPSSVHGKDNIGGCTKPYFELFLELDSLTHRIVIGSMILFICLDDDIQILDLIKKLWNKNQNKPDYI